MATDARELAEPTEPDDDTDPTKDWYDRSSLKGDFMVMIADQTEEDYLRRCPENKFCEFIDGIVYLHSHASNMPEPADDPDDPTQVWYDRSSLDVDAMVMIPDQTLDDYFRRAPENKICEYIDGIVYMPSPASLGHQDDVILLTFLLRGFLSRHPVGRLILAPASLKVGAKRFLEPDLFVIPPDHLVDSRSFFVDPPVLLVIEVLSKSTRSQDLNRKIKLYRQVKAGEIWFVDHRNEVLIVHRRMGNRYKVLEIKSGPYLSQSVPGFWLDISWLWDFPEPDVIACLTAILAGPPA
jgi:Uma2 family endonuclease